MMEEADVTRSHLSWLTLLLEATHFCPQVNAQKCHKQRKYEKKKRYAEGGLCRYRPILLCCATCYFTRLNLSDSIKFLTVTFIFSENKWSITLKLAALSATARRALNLTYNPPTHPQPMLPPSSLLPQTQTTICKRDTLGGDFCPQLEAEAHRSGLFFVMFLFVFRSNIVLYTDRENKFLP